MEKKYRKRKIDISGLSTLEADIMQVIWQKKKVTVREVHEERLKRGYIPYTTVMAAMNNLAQKGLLKQNRNDKAYIYSPALGRDKVAKLIIDSVVDKVLGGSNTPVLRHLLKLKTNDEVEEIIKLRDKLNL
ncbi:MAG: BlaI/MecI/CopY family transcriptional regulator [Firmicutes bacterium]|nr:BlaI/MecI/CopY family transcriptional regulator [Bacillota bacterium]